MSVNIDVEADGPFASKPAPTGFKCSKKSRDHLAAFWFQGSAFSSVQPRQEISDRAYNY